MVAAPSPPPIRQTSSWEEIDRIQCDAIRALAAKLGRPLAILEAGCGQRWTLDLSGVDYTLTGVDLDRDALELRRTVAKDLDVAIYGDLCSVELPEETYDVVYSSFVLEHVPRADVALANLLRWLRPGGLLILRLPERSTARDFLTRVLPHWAHVLFYKYVAKLPHAGEPGYAPYPTYYHPVISREALCAFLASNGIACQGIYGDGFRREGSGLMKWAVLGLVKATALASFGRLTSDYIDLLYVADKRGGTGGDPHPAN
jgi:ubiquinone/menaquinone biosynthesis C-methylase UbiE